jgi:hypothetical protein
MGILGTGGGGRGKLSDVEHKVTVSSFCRRRLAVVMQRVGMADFVSSATKYIEQGHVRVGAEVVTDPAFLVTRYVSHFRLAVDVGLRLITGIGIWRISSHGSILRRLRGTFSNTATNWTISICFREC